MDFKRLLSALAVAAMMASAASVASAQNGMTDQQVIEYVKSAAAQGKDRQQMAKELAVRGVTQEQARRVYQTYQKETKDKGDAATEEASRSHSLVEEALSMDSAQTDSLAISTDLGEAEDKIFGMDIFSANASFTPSENMATPKNYRLGPGDEVIIDIFGANQATIRSTISPEGSINVDVLGPIYLSGKTIDEANSYLKKRLASIYGGLGGGGSRSDILLSLGQIRSIQVSVMGDVKRPGTYSISSFSTVFHALYRAGGVVEPGDLRGIKVMRGGVLVGTADVYDLIVSGNDQSNIQLSEGDVILVPPYQGLARVSGAVKRPMRYEVKEGETLSDVLSYAGGFSTDANRSRATVIRQNGSEYNVYNVDEDEFRSFGIEDGDEVSINSLNSIFENKVTVSGAVYQPGVYAIDDNVRTVKALINQAGGLLPEAFTTRTVLRREHQDKTHEVIPINLRGLLDGSFADIRLENQDELYIASEYELRDVGELTINGAVRNPGTYSFAENTTIEDMIILAGGLEEGASTARVDVYRRINDPTGKVRTSEAGRLFSFSLENGFVVGNENSFYLEPYDEVRVFMSPSYSTQMHVSVEGEVNFPGEFSMSTRDERISSLIQKAGGLTDLAYVQGIRIYRKVTAAEAYQNSQLSKRLDKLRTSAPLDSLSSSSSSSYLVSVDVAAAMAEPGGSADVVLREGDRVVVPVFSNTVSIDGAVMSSTTVGYNAKWRAGDYVKSAGGYAPRAKKSKAFIIAMNGQSRPLNSGAKIQPGDKIIVPMKPERPDAGTSMQRMSSMAQSMTALTTMALAIISLF